METTDTADGTSEPQPDTPSTAPTSRRGSARGAAAAASPQAADTSAPGSGEAAEPDTSGWYRNDGATAVTVVPHGTPSAYLRPGAAAWLPSDPAIPFLVACDGPTDIEAGPEPAQTETEA